MNPRIKLVKIISGFGVESPLGGIEQFVISLCKEFNQNIFDISIFGLWSYGSIFEQSWQKELEDLNIRTLCGCDWNPIHPYNSFINSVFQLKDKMIEFKPDIIHSHGQFCDVAAILLASRNLGLLARTVHEDLEWRDKPLRRLLFSNIIYPLLFKIEIGVSKNITKRLSSRPLSNFLRRKSIQINNSIDLSRFSNFTIEKKTKKIDLALPLDKPIIGSIGRLTLQKGYSTFLKAIKLIIQEQYDAYFVIVGDGEYRDQLKIEADNLGITNYIQFLGPRSDIRELYKIMDIFVSSSLWEGLPTVLLESMASGTPIIATNIPGSCDLINHYRNGLLFPPDSPKELAQSIILLLNNPKLRKQFILNGQETINHYSIKNAAKKYSELYLDY